MIWEHHSRGDFSSGRKFKTTFPVYLHNCINLKSRWCVNSNIYICQCFLICSCNYRKNAEVYGRNFVGPASKYLGLSYILASWRKSDAKSSQEFRMLFINNIWMVVADANEVSYHMAKVVTLSFSRLWVTGVKKSWLMKMGLKCYFTSLWFELLWEGWSVLWMDRHLELLLKNILLKLNELLLC